MRRASPPGRASASARTQLAAAAVAGLAGLSSAGCSLISPVPLWELTKAAGAVAVSAIPYGSSEASNTVYHAHPAFDRLCIEYNPDTAVGDVVPVLQRELRKHRIESRVYDSGIDTEACRVWLRYVASIAWDVQPLSGSGYRPYVDAAALTLQAADGSVLSSSQYEATGVFGRGKWASTESKLAPVVSALLTGFQN